MNNDRTASLPFLLVSICCFTAGTSLWAWFITMFLLAGVLGLKDSKNPAQSLAVLLCLVILACLWI